PVAAMAAIGDGKWRQTDMRRAGSGGVVGGPAGATRDGGVALGDKLLEQRAQGRRFDAEGTLGSGVGQGAMLVQEAIESWIEAATAGRRCHVTSGFDRRWSLRRSTARLNGRLLCRLQLRGPLGCLRWPCLCGGGCDRRFSRT